MTEESKYSEALKKSQSYCAYQERCNAEVREKLFGMGLSNLEIEKIITALISKGFLNEERYAIAFARGKFRIKKWGRIKIKAVLRAKQISESSIKVGLMEIEDKEYIDALKEFLQKKNKEIKEKDSLSNRSKIARHAISKGFETEIVWEILNSLRA